MLMKEIVYAGWKECKMKGERNQKRVRGEMWEFGG